MATMQDSKPSELVSQAAEELKKAKAVQIPEWAKIVKTGPAQEHPPVEKDWWYKRAASILRKVSLRGPIGVAKLRSFYGNMKTVHTEKAIQSIVVIAQLVQQNKITEKITDDQYKNLLLRLIPEKKEFRITKNE